MNIKKNPDNNKYEEVTQAVKDNDGYCPCELEKNENTKCICKTFKDSQEKGECHCGRFVKE